MPDPRRIQGFLSGFVATNVTNGQIIAAMISVTNSQIRNVVAGVTAAGGSGTTIIDVQINNVSVWTDPANRPTNTGGAVGKFAGGVPPNRRAVNLGDVVKIIVAAAGNHSGVVATLALEEP